jgi:hypothetical protein
MVTTLNFKDYVDLLKWRNLSPPYFVPNAAGTNSYICCSDMRNDISRHPIMYVISGNTTELLYAYSQIGDEWQALSSVAVIATAPSAMFFMGGQGPRGTLAAGSTTTTVTLTTALPATVGVNNLANRGDDIGFKIRIIGNSAGGSGKTEERFIIANSAGTTPTIVLDSPLSFTPALGDGYEFLSGKLYMLGSLASAGSFKYYDIATNSLSGNLSVTNLTVAAGSCLLGLDEQLVPYDRNPGEGFLGILVATASGAISITGQTTSGDTNVLTNEYRNFQIRIVQDIAIPTSVGQRRNITSHTAGPNPVYTVPIWTVQPSATASYVIENNGDRILEWSPGSTITCTYKIASDTWDANTTFAARPDAINLARAVQAFSIEPDVAKYSRQSYIFTYSDTTVNFDLFDIAGAATGSWTQYITVRNMNNAISGVGNDACQDPFTEEGRYWYFTATVSGIILFFRLDIKNRIVEPITRIKVPFINNSGSSYTVRPMSMTLFIDGSTKLSFLNYLTNKTDYSTGQFFQLPLTIG